MKATARTTKEQQQTTLPTFMTVREMARELRISVRDAYDYLPDIPGVIKLSERRTRIPRAGFTAFVNAIGGRA